MTEVPSLASGQSGFQVDGVSGWLAFDPADEGTGGDTTQRSITYDAIDNLGEVTSECVYAGNGVAMTSTNGVPDQPAADLLRAETSHLYNAQGQEYETDVHNVDQSNGRWTWTPPRK